MAEGAVGHPRHGATLQISEAERTAEEAKALAEEAQAQQRKAAEALRAQQEVVAELQEQLAKEARERVFVEGKLAEAEAKVGAGKGGWGRCWGRLCRCCKGRPFAGSVVWVLQGLVLCAVGGQCSKCCVGWGCAVGLWGVLGVLWVLRGVGGWASAALAWRPGGMCGVLGACEQPGVWGPRREWSSVAPARLALHSGTWDCRRVCPAVERLHLLPA